MLIVRGCSSAGRAPALQAGGQRFESAHLHQCIEVYLNFPLIKILVFFEIFVVNIMKSVDTIEVT